MRRFDVGAGFGLAEARRKANDLRRQIREEVDPTAERRALRARAKAAEQGIGTFGTVIDAYFSDRAGRGAEVEARAIETLALCLCGASGATRTGYRWRSLAVNG